MVQGTPQDRPRFRQDLVAEPIDEQGARFIDVIDPDSGNGFRFYEVEYSLACAMDGERDIEGIVRWATEELGVTPSSSEVRTVIATLGELGYLEGVGAVGEAAPPAAAQAPVAIEAPPAARAPVAAAPARASQPPAQAAQAVEIARQTAPVDDELAHGIVVGQDRAAADSIGDFELGHVGPAARVDDGLPEAPDYALGAPGRAEPPRGMPSMPTGDDIPLGVAGASRHDDDDVEMEAVPQAPDMSLDLSDQFALGKDDVKEAVRQSRVMSAVDVPKDLMDQLEAPAVAPTPKAVPAPVPVAAPVVKAAQTPMPPQPATKPGVGPGPAAPAPVPPSPKLAAKPEPKVAAKPAVDLPAVAKQMPAPNEPAKAAPTAPKRGTNPLLIAIAIVVIVAAAGFFVWQHWFADGDAPDETATPKHAHKMKQPDPPAAPPAPPTPAPAPTAKLATEQPPGQDLKAAMAGVIEMVAANDTAVKAGDVVAKLAGHQAIDADLAGLAHDIDKRVPAEITAAEQALAAATTANNKAGEAAAQAQLDDRHKSLATKQAVQSAKQAELAKYLITAPSDGKVTAVGKVGAKVAPDDVVAKVGGAPALAATFDAAAGDARKAGDAVTLAVGDKQIACTVASVDAGKIKVTCPADATVADGTVATLAK